jgi:hypothetical protein
LRIPQPDAPPDLVGMNAAAAAPWLPFRMRDLAVSFYRCPIDLFLRHEHPRSGNEIWSRAFGPAYGIQREDEDR